MSGDVWPLVLAGQMTIEESQDERLRRLFVQYGEPFDAVQVSTAGDHYRAAYARSQQPVAGVVTLLQRLKSLTQIGVVTNNLTAHQRTKLRICQIDHLVDFMVTSEDTGTSKPDPAIFEVALCRANCLPQEAVMIGDSWSADVLGAHAAGIRAIWLNRVGDPCPDPALAVEITALEPVDALLPLIFGER
jgi:putative hydrolase of the HAD superfamily